MILSDQHGQIYTQMEDGRIRTPQMMRIAEEGLSFSHCYCNAPLCVPSRMSFLSGKLPGELQIFNNDTTLPADMPTIAHAMGIAGYHTVLAGRMHFKGDEQNHGFDERLVGDITSQYWGTGGRQRTDFGAYVQTTNRKHCLNAVGGGYSPVMAYDEAVFKEAMEYLEKDQETPLFMVVGFYGPHFPFACEPSLYKYYKGILSPDELTELDCEKEYEGYRQEFSLERARNCKAAYYGLVETLDSYVGALYDAFGRRCRDGKGLFLYTSDHGEQLGAHGIFGKQTLYEESIRVPLLIAGDGVRQEIRTEQVSLLDVSKTVMAEAGVDASWHNGKAIPLGEPEEKRPPVVTQQVLNCDPGLLFAEAVIQMPYKAVKMGENIRVYRLDPAGEEQPADVNDAETKRFLKEAEAHFTKKEEAAGYLHREQQQKKQHEILKEWGRRKHPLEPTCMEIPERARIKPVE